MQEKLFCEDVLLLIWVKHTYSNLIYTKWHVDKKKKQKKKGTRILGKIINHWCPSPFEMGFIHLHILIVFGYNFGIQVTYF